MLNSRITALHKKSSYKLILSENLTVISTIEKFTDIMKIVTPNDKHA